MKYKGRQGLPGFPVPHGRWELGLDLNSSCSNSKVCALNRSSHVSAIHYIFLLQSCFSCSDKTLTKSNLGRIELISAHRSIMERSQKKNSGQELGGKTWSRGHGGACFLACFSWLLQCDFLDNSRPPVKVWHHPQSTGSQWTLTSTINQENAPTSTHRPLWWRWFLSWGFLFPGDYSMCQVNLN